MTAAHEIVRSLTNSVKGKVINFIWTIYSPLQVYLMGCIQEVLTVVGLSHKIFKEFWGDRH
jgi:hypothetical protein